MTNERRLNRVVTLQCEGALLPGLSEPTSGVLYIFYTKYFGKPRTMATDNQVLLKEHLATEQMTQAQWKDASSCLFPPIGPAAAQKPIRTYPFLATLSEQQSKLENTTSLLAELVRIEQELRESLQREEERQQELECIRQEENRQRWRNLCFLSLNQRTTKPWVTSYYKNIPMHIYCLPIETVSQRQKQKKKR